VTATNHALAGAAIGFLVKEPVLALPLALASHFVMDAIPHVGLDEFGGHHKQPKLFRKILSVDAALLALIIGILWAYHAPPLVFACLFIAGSPDFIWAYRYVFQEKLGNIAPKAKSSFSHFHSKIQWSQTLRGVYIEIPCAGLLLLYISTNL
jgi:hypothetical protein